MEIEMEEGGGGGALHATESEVDLDAVAQAEYSRMKRQYFLMQRHRQHVMEKAGAGGGSSGSSKQSKGGKLVQLLEIQRDNLESDLAAATSSTNVKKDEQTKARIWKLLHVYEKYKSQVESLQTDIKAMEKTVGKMTTKFYKAKLKIQAVLGVAVSIGRLEKTIENKETKLHLVKSQYDILMIQNRELKDDIAVKINRRFAIFNRMTKLNDKMMECRKSLNSSVDEALTVYNVWDDAARKINFIKDKYKDEVRQHILEIKEYDRLLFHDLREIRFYSTKNKPRSLLEESSNRDARKTARDIVNLQKECRRYRNQFLRLEEFDPKQNVDTIISNYRALEYKSFAYFQQISDFNKEGLKLMDEIHILKKELDILAHEKERADKSNDEELLRLEVSRDNERDKLAHLKAQLEVTDESTKKVIDAVETFFTTAECDLGPLQDLLGHNEHITTQNLREAFNLLEQHIATMQLEKELLNIQKEVETHTAYVVPKTTKVHRSSGGPYEPQAVVPSRPELGMEKKNDEEDTLFAAAPIPKAVQREHLVAQMRELGLIGSPPPPIRRSESVAVNSGKGIVERPARTSIAASQKPEEEEREKEKDKKDDDDDEEQEAENVAVETNVKKSNTSLPETTAGEQSSRKDSGQQPEIQQTEQAAQVSIPPPPGERAALISSGGGNDIGENPEQDEEEDGEEEEEEEDGQED